MQWDWCLIPGELEKNLINLIMGSAKSCSQVYHEVFSWLVFVVFRGHHWVHHCASWRIKCNFRSFSLPFLPLIYYCSASFFFLHWLSLCRTHEKLESGSGKHPAYHSFHFTCCSLDIEKCHWLNQNYTYLVKWWFSDRRLPSTNSTWWSKLESWIEMRRIDLTRRSQQK